MRYRANRASIESCRLVLNAHELSANGCLRPGWSGKWNIGDGKAPVAIKLRAEADRLHLSWNRQSVAGEEGITEEEPSEEGAGEDEIGKMTESVSLAHFLNHFGGGYTLFVCPGPQGGNSGDSDDARDTNGIASGGASGDGAAASCGRRVVRLYLARRYFLCRQCSQLVYSSPYELPWQRALRRVNKLRQRLGADADPGMIMPAPDKPNPITLDHYERLLDELLRAEITAVEAQAEHLQQLVARIDARSRREPKFTL